MTLLWISDVLSRRRTNPIPKRGLWLLQDSAAGVDRFLRLIVDREGQLYALGEGQLFRRAGESWEKLGAYAPTLSWDEAEGVSAEGDFPSSILDQLSREASLALASELEAMDGDAPPEEIAELVIEAFRAETAPQPKSPLALSDVALGTAGAPDQLWIATGGGVLSYRPERRGLFFHRQSPNALHEISLSRQGIWGVDAEGGVRATIAPDKSLRWSMTENQDTVYQRMSGEYRARAGKLFWRRRGEEERPVMIPGEVNSVTLGSGDQLWVLSGQQLYLIDRGLLQPLCDPLPRTPIGLRWSGGSLITWRAREIWVHSAGCARIRLSPPRGSGEILDLALNQEGLWISTALGLFRWTKAARGQRSAARVALVERALSERPPFPVLYRAVLRAQGLDRESWGYGLRPLSAMLLPELQLRASTRPLRSDRTPTIFGGNRQLRLEQPRPEVTLFARWTISFDALAGLFGIEGRSRTGSEQLEAEIQGLGITQQENLDFAFDELDPLGADATLAARSQRISQTLLALERRQAVRERRRLRRLLLRLYEEQTRLIWRRWMTNPRDPLRLALWRLRIKEIDALFLAYHGAELPGRLASGG
ncbi:MAG: hypothetical protein VYD19_02280 [Myxococcota bacterium]|nr:hypothetical protein [Myxococcota bacterium]